MKLLHGESHVLGLVRGSGFLAQCKSTIRLLLGSVLLLLSLPSHAVFTTPGSFEVGPDGSANYTIPIQVPPGTGGMAPQLSLSYSSSGGNGLLGMGWSLEGLSQIGRCGKTIAQDGVRGGVNFDANDKFCLDGQRLVSTGGTYGANGTEYRTELANFAKIISYGTAGTGPAWFKVWTKGGQILEYGNTEDSRIEASGKPTAMLWGVNKISDTKGNYITVTYVEDNANGESYISRVDYTGNATTNLAPYASVRFSYEARPDISVGYHAGSISKLTKRMTNVKTYTGELMVKDYRLNYELSVLSKRSILNSVMECSNDTNFSCLKGINFSEIEVQQVFIGGLYQFPLGWDFGTPLAAAWQTIEGDFNGDGKSDFARLGPKYAHVFLSRGDGTFDGSVYGYPAGWDFGAPATNLWETLTGDFNGDGATDFARFKGKYGHVFFSNRDGSFNSTTYTFPNEWDFGTPLAAAWQTIEGDFNGDGKSDFARFQGRYGHVFITPPILTDALFSIIDGWKNKISITYSPLTNSGTYTKDSGTNASVYPLQDVQAAMYVVSSVASSDGIGGTVTTNYSYGGLKADLNGRGSLGFRWVKITTPDADSVVTSYYRQDYPFIGLPSSTEKRQFSTNTLLSSSVPTYANVDITTGSAVSKFPNVSQSVEKSYELDGSLVSETTTTNQYDSYGNVTQVTVSSGDGYVKTTTSTYSNDAANWLLGRLLKSVVTSTTPN